MTRRNAYANEATGLIHFGSFGELEIVFRSGGIIL
jgi:hypothetical protein